MAQNRAQPVALKVDVRKPQRLMTLCKSGTNHKTKSLKELQAMAIIQLGNSLDFFHN